MALCPLPAGRTAGAGRANVKASAFLPALTSTSVIGAVGVLAVLVDRPWLFPSLGPTIFLQTVNPDQSASTPWNTLAGHAAGAAAAFLALALFGALHTPPAVAGGVLTPSRAAASALAVGLTIALQQVARAQHAPAAATTLLLTLGALPATGGSVLALAIGVGLVTGLGEIARRLHLANAPRAQR
jgi:hypothetical protein